MSSLIGAIDAMQEFLQRIHKLCWSVNKAS